MGSQSSSREREPRAASWGCLIRCLPPRALRVGPSPAQLRAPYCQGTGKGPGLKVRMLGLAWMPSSDQLTPLVGKSSSVKSKEGGSSLDSSSSSAYELPGIFQANPPAFLTYCHLPPHSLVSNCRSQMRGVLSSSDLTQYGCQLSGPQEGEGVCLPAPRSLSSWDLWVQPILL